MTTNASVSPSAPPMPATSPFEILADELGAVAGRIERESSLRVAAVVSDLERRDAERELRLVKIEQGVAERLAALRDGKDGKDGEPGPAGRDGADGEPGEGGEKGERGDCGDAGSAKASLFPGEMSTEEKVEMAASILLREVSVLGEIIEIPPPALVAAGETTRSINITVENHMPARAGERTVVTKHDEAGRIKEFERHEIGEA